MAVFQGLATPQVTIDGVNIGIVPNTFMYTEGFGEQAVMVQSAGGGSVSQVRFDNVENHVSKIKFSAYSIENNIEFFRTVKSQPTVAHVVQVAAGNNLTRSFSNMVITNDYEVNLQSDGKFDIEMSGSSAS